MLPIISLSLCFFIIMEDFNAMGDGNETEIPATLSVAIETNVTEIPVTLSVAVERNVTKAPVTLSASMEKMVKDLPLDRQESLRNHFEDIQREREKSGWLKPQMDLKSAIFCMKVFTSEFYNRFGVKKMEGEAIPWPERIKPIIDRNDKYTPGLYYENMHIKVPNYESQGMNKSYFNWFAYASWNLSNQPSKPDHFKERDLQNSLMKYFTNLEPEKRKKLYGNEPGLDEVTAFKRYFAAIISRCYKFACNVCNYVEGYLADLHSHPSTRQIHFIDGIKRILPTWYFDEEMLDMLNILGEARNSSAWITQNKRFFNAMTFVNSLNQSVLLPGLDGLPVQQV